ncbi:MAG: hypothetical protein F4153_02505 [Acidimicrobiia bacterium]|nr:hypothetical protein [Acidimicrobiia bacterium]
MDKQTIHLITLIIAIIGSNAWSHTSLSERISGVENRLSDRIVSLEARVDKIDKRLIIVETSLKANNQYIASVLGQRLQQPDVPGEQ